MSQLKVRCIEQVLMFENTPEISSGNVNYDSITFSFCSSWDGFTKTAIFYRSEDEVYYQLLDEANTCIIPKEVLTEKGVIHVGVFGVMGEVTLTSQVVTYRISQGAITEDLKPSDPTPDIYAQIISRYNHYDERLAYFEERFNGSVGDAEKFGGQLPSYYATAEALNALQTTSEGTLSTAGWYRVAEYDAHTSLLIGAHANHCVLSINRTYETINNEYHVLKLRSKYQFQEFKSLDDYSNTQLITKARYTHDGDKAYLEVYYKGTTSNECVFVVNGYKSPNTAYFWQAISPTLTQETVDGVTVTTTYDIPANASPVTDLDLAQVDGTTALSTPLLETALTLKNGSYVFSIASGYSGGDLPSSGYANGNVSIFKRGGNSISVVLWGTTGNASKIAKNYYNGTSWSGWNEYATTADLAKYLPLTGGTVNGNLYVGDGTEAVARYFALRNKFRNIAVSVDTSGNLKIYDNTNGKSVFNSTADGTNTFYGTATGNLPINSNGKIPVEVHIQKADNGYTRIVKNNSATADYGTNIYDVSADGKNARLSWSSGSKTPYFVDSDGKESDLLHTGNSAKVHIGTSAPSDTNALWIDTSA